MYCTRLLVCNCSLDKSLFFANLLLVKINNTCWIRLFGQEKKEEETEPAIFFLDAILIIINPLKK